MVSSLRRGHADLSRIVPILTYVLNDSVRVAGWPHHRRLWRRRREGRAWLQGGRGPERGRGQGRHRCRRPVHGGRVVGGRAGEANTEGHVGRATTTLRLRAPIKQHTVSCPGAWAPSATMYAWLLGYTHGLGWLGHDACTAFGKQARGGMAWPRCMHAFWDGMATMHARLLEYTHGLGWLGHGARMAFGIHTRLGIAWP